MTPVPPPQGRHAVPYGRHRRRRRFGLTGVRLALASVAAVAGSLALVAPAPASAPSAPSAASPAAPEQAGDGPVAARAQADDGPPAPVAVRIPSLGVDSSLVDLGVDADGVLVPPPDFDRAGWFTGGPAPGAVGPAVIAGHVDSYEGPAVFFRLGELRSGDEVLVDRADGTTARFTVREVARYPKADFPTEQVYGPTPRAELRLITCGGDFDPDRRSYDDNVVVTAVLAD